MLRSCHMWCINLYIHLFAENFKKVLSATIICQAVKFDFDCTFVKQYFGYDKSHQLDYFEFSQLLQVSMTIYNLSLSFSLTKNLPTEHARQAFRLRDKDQSGTIPALEFVELMTLIRGFRMSDHIQENLLAVSPLQQLNIDNIHCIKWVGIKPTCCLLLSELYYCVVRWQEDLLVGKSVILISKLSIKCWVTWICFDK